MAGLKTLLPETAASQTSYAGEVSPTQAWSILSENPDALLIDVRTPQEWASVGIPEKAPGNRDALLLSWRLPVSFELNPSFLDELRLQQPSTDAPLFFLCKTGGRSFEAANAAVAAGFPNSYNVTHGFEGDPDGEGQRGKVNGWLAEGLPWRRA